MAASDQRQLKLTSTLSIIFTITVISVMGTASIAPALPDFQEHFKISGSNVALLITVFTIPGVILIPVAGWLADKYGRKRILIPSLILFALAGFSCFFASSFFQLLVLRFIQGVGSAPLNSLNNTLITDNYNEPKRITVLGYNGGVLSIATALYPALGGFLALLGWNFPFLLPLAALPLAILVGIYIKEPEIHKETFESRDYFKSVIRSINKEVFLIILLVLISFMILFGVFITFFPFLVEQRFHFDSATIGLLMAVMSFSAAFIAFRIGVATKKLNLRKLLQFSFLLYAIACFGLFLSSNLISLIVSILLFGMAQGYCEICALSLLSFHAPKGLRGIFMSFNGMAILLGQTIGPILMSWIVFQFQLNAMFYIVAGFSLIIFLSLFLWKKLVPPQ